MLGGHALDTDPIRDQPLVGYYRIIERHHHALAHLRMRAQTRFDLAQFDAETADLDLVIVASNKLDCAIGTPAPQIASAVHACCRISNEWIRQEALDRQVVSVQIPPSYAVATDIQLTRHPNRDRRTVYIEDIDPYVGNRTTDRWCARHTRITFMHTCADRRLCGAVCIDQASALAPTFYDACRECLAGNDECLQTGKRWLFRQIVQY